MEFPARLIRVQRFGAAAMLGAVLLVAWLEGRSPTAAAARQGVPLVGFLALKTPSAPVPELFAAVYRPALPALDLIYLPETTELPDGSTLAKVNAAALRSGSTPRDAAKAMAEAAQPALDVVWPQGDGAWAAPFYYDEAPQWEHEPPLEGRRYIAEASQGLGFWRELVHRATKAGRGSGLEPFELLRLGHEFHGLPAASLRAAWLPDPPDRDGYFSRLLSPAPQTKEQAVITVEILNATGLKGIASKATKILRSKGADVVSTGNADAQSGTVVYDRTGRPELASQVIQMLGCGSAQAVTQINAKRLVDVSVVIAGDCD